MFPEQVGFHAVQLIRQSDDDSERIKQGITSQMSVHEYLHLSCIPFFGLQGRYFQKQLQSIIEFPPCYTEEIYQFALCHCYFAFAFANDLHTVAPLEITAVSFSLIVIGILRLPPSFPLSDVSLSACPYPPKSYCLSPVRRFEYWI